VLGKKIYDILSDFYFFTPLCLCFYLHGAYLFYHDHCHLFVSESAIHGLIQVFKCSPAVIWFTSIAVLHIVWISGLCMTMIFQIATGYTTNEKMNSWRYKYLKSRNSSPFSLGWIQNLVDLINRRILWYIPVNIDWARIYSIEDFYQSIPIRIRQKLNLSSIELLNV